MIDGAKLLIEVMAGVIPGKEEEEFTRRWVWTCSQQERLSAGDPKAREEWVSMAGESREYAATLENPQRINWVRRDWLWL